MYSNGKGVQRSDPESVVWYRKAADQGFAKAQYNLGTMFENGKGVQQNDSEAVRWYRKAADQGLADAQIQLDLMTKMSFSVKIFTEGLTPALHGEE